MKKRDFKPLLVHIARTALVDTTEFEAQGGRHRVDTLTDTSFNVLIEMPGEPKRYYNFKIVEVTL